jgi:hypothetical protein
MAMPASQRMKQRTSKRKIWMDCGMCVPISKRKRQQPKWKQRHPTKLSTLCAKTRLFRAFAWRFNRTSMSKQQQVLVWSRGAWPLGSLYLYCHHHRHCHCLRTSKCIGTQRRVSRTIYLFSLGKTTLPCRVFALSCARERDWTNKFVSLRAIPVLIQEQTAAHGFSSSARHDETPRARAMETCALDGVCVCVNFASNQTRVWQCTRRRETRTHIANFGRRGLARASVRCARAREKTTGGSQSIVVDCTVGAWEANVAFFY